MKKMPTYDPEALEKWLRFLEENEGHWPVIQAALVYTWELVLSAAKNEGMKESFELGVLRAIISHIDACIEEEAMSRLSDHIEPIEV